jgi:hypothetical protein
LKNDENSIETSDWEKNKSPKNKIPKALSPKCKINHFLAKLEKIINSTQVY